MQTFVLALLLIVAPQAQNKALVEAKALTAANRAEEAIPLLQRTLADAPELTEGWVQLGHAQLNLTRYAQAATAYQQALALDQNQQDVRYNLAYAFRSAGDLKNAIRTYETYLKSTPNDPDALFGWAESLKGDERWAAAADAFDRYAAAENRANQSKWTAYARSQSTELRTKALSMPIVEDTPALRTLDIETEDSKDLDFIESPPATDEEPVAPAAPLPVTDRPASFAQGIKFLQAGDYARALKPLAEAARARPTDAVVLTALGGAHLGMSDADAALAAYRRALAVAPRPSIVATLHFAIAEALRLRGDRDQAKGALNQVIADENAPPNLKRLARDRLSALP
ncbi:MAG: tetratricopeptide repeat protein [Myxococcota bacterium]